MLDLNPTELWDLCLEAVQDRIEPIAFRSWLEKTMFFSLDDNYFTVNFPNDFIARTAKIRFGEILDEIFLELSGRPDLTLKFTGPAAGPSVVHNDSILLTDNKKTVKSAVRNTDYLRPNYTFERFMEGPSNQLAHAGAIAISRNPNSESYNPLFIYGDVGLGKTHLIQAIAHEIRSKKTFRYISSELFLQQYIKAIETAKMDVFRNKFLNVDYLLIDDIQFLRGKEGLQEQFFHRFNEFYQKGRQIVITSDRPPHELDGIEKRLISRFQSGLVADIKPPEYETRIAIIKLLTRDENLTIPFEVVDYIASAVRHNVRQLSGIVHRLAATSKLLDVDIDLDFVHREIETSLGSSSKRVTPGAITAAVAEEFEVSPSQLKGKQRRHDVLVPRQVAMVLIRDLTTLSLKEIGSFFSGRDHSTVLNSIERIKILCEDNFELKRKISTIKQKITAL
ncbi:MAG: chromosomal replication initiator protein DnaA [Candidatus Brocadiales bacterium]|nr:chromosomal replication initiator protein DnaA [Candidatus Brocadiales bacterium]